MEKKEASRLISDQVRKIVKGKEEISKAVVGQEKVIESLFRAIVCNGHVLLEGVPGIAKTLMVRSLAAITGTAFSRIQFTPDLLPSDIIGITSYHEKKGFFVIKGPIFGNFILGDEINRSPPKVQSALLEAMQERQVTIGKETFPIPNPFFVLATQNPIESLGTYPLPAAQMDRFLFKLNVGYPDLVAEKGILEENITTKDFSSFGLKPVISGRDILIFQRLVHYIYSDEKIKQYIVNIVDATRNPSKYKIKLGKYIEYGGSPRASIGLYIGSKAEALLKGKSFVIPEYVKTVAYDVLRHRLLINYEGQSENVMPEEIVDEILSKVPIP
jgi:MoxR-like ATPase